MPPSWSSRSARNTTMGEASSSSSSPPGTILHQNANRHMPATPATIPSANPGRRQTTSEHAPEYRWPGAVAAHSVSINVSQTQNRADRGHHFTVGNVSNGLIYLRYGLPDHTFFHRPLPIQECHLPAIVDFLTSRAPQLGQSREGRRMISSRAMPPSCHRLRQIRPKSWRRGNARRLRPGYRKHMTELIRHRRRRPPLGILRLTAVKRTFRTQNRRLRYHRHVT